MYGHKAEGGGERQRERQHEEEDLNCENGSFSARMGLCKQSICPKPGYARCWKLGGMPVTSGASTLLLKSLESAG